jgi:hypothetical protein
MSQISTKYILPGTVATSFPTDAGTATPALNALTIAGGTNIGTSGAGSTVTINLDGTTNHAVQVGSAAGALTSLAVGLTGTILQGVAANDPVWSTATYPATVVQGDILCATAANVIGVITATNPVGQVLTSTGVTSAPTWQALPPSSFPGGVSAWTEITGAAVNLAVNNGYIMNRGTLITGTLPAVAAQGTVIRVVGVGVGGWQIAQNAGQTIYFDSYTSTPGVTGYIASTLARDCVELLCIVANTEFQVMGSIGSITIA